jgi:hypothetical protein
MAPCCVTRHPEPLGGWNTAHDGCIRGRVSVRRLGYYGETAASRMACIPTDCGATRTTSTAEPAANEPEIDQLFPQNTPTRLCARGRVEVQEVRAGLASRHRRHRRLMGGEHIPLRVVGHGGSALEAGVGDARHELCARPRRRRISVVLRGSSPKRQKKGSLVTHRSSTWRPSPASLAFAPVRPPER